MTICILCDSTDAIIASIEDKPGFTAVNCPICYPYWLANALFDDLPKESDWSTFKTDLARVVRWRHFQGPLLAIDSIHSARLAVMTLNEFEEDTDKREQVAIAALAGLDEDPWKSPIKRAAKALGVSEEEARNYIKDLEARGLIWILDLGQPRPVEGANQFKHLVQWVRASVEDVKR